MRVFIPDDPFRSDLPAVLGHDIVHRLSNRYRCAYIRVPLGRELRATRYREAGMTNRDIARKLGLTETGVEKIFKRGRAKDREKIRRRKDPRQTEMF
ncbi:hypothetical protein J2W92_002310 [Rhizobium leguminosarum]